MLNLLDVWNAKGKTITYKEISKKVKDVRTKAGIDLQVLFEDDSILTININMMKDIKIS